jgi:hypothetical protein
MDGIPFSAVLQLLESHGWKFKRVWKPYRMFEKPGEMPFLLEVHDRMVSYEYFEKVNELVRQEDAP